MPDLNCPSTSTSKREISQKFKNKYCSFLKNTNFNDVLKNKQITSLKILDENTKGGNLKSGEIYVGTDSGVYFIYNNGTISKFDGLNFTIKDIILDNNGSAYVKANGLIYHLNLYGWGHTIVHDEL